MRVLNLNNLLPSTLYPHKVTYIMAMGECMRHAGDDEGVTVDVDDDGIRYERPATLPRKIAAYARLWWRCATRNLSKYDIVYVSHVPFCWPILLNPSLRRSRLFIHWHGNDLVGGGAARLLRMLLLKGPMKRALHIVPSHYFIDRLSEVYPWARILAYIAASGGVDTELFSAVERPRDRFVIGFPSELTAAKGADAFAALMERHADIEAAIGREVEFAVIDYGSEAAKWIDRYRATGARLRVVGKMARHEMPGFYHTLSMAAVLSTRRGESLGLVALEAMSCGLPVLARNMCAFPEFVKPGETGELVEPDAPAESLVERTIAIARGDYNPRAMVESRYSPKVTTLEYRVLFFS